MALPIGTRLGPYEILAPIGAGGMGEVYKARDTRLDRIVAIKIGREKFSERFEREARAVAALNHPNICTLFDVGSNYFVMEYIEGSTLKGPLSVETALKYGAQICEALAVAHRKGITHRDLKPGNILVTKSGIKLLDFGLAKRSGPLKDTDPTQALTGENAIVGTLNYMSPEQLQSKEADARSDIFSFGLVLYEMLTGKRAFEGDSTASVIAAILERQAPSVADVAPQSLDRVLKTCLAKDPEERWQSARDLQRELEWAAARDTLHTTSSRSFSWLGWAGWAVAGLLAVGGAVGWVRNVRTAEVPQEVAFVIPPPTGLELTRVGSLTVDRLSPDGSMIYFRASDRRYHLRRLSSAVAEQLPDWYWFGDPFWAPDSQSIAFPVRGRIFKMRVPKGAQELVADIGSERGGSWSDKGVILVGRGDEGLYTVPGPGGKATPLGVSGLAKGRYFNPQFLPGGAEFVFSFSPADSGADQIYLATFQEGKAANLTLLLENDTSVSFTPTGGGRLLFVRKNNLYSEKLDLSRRSLKGDPELLQENVATWAGPRVAYFSVSRNGSIAWRSGTEVLSQVTILDRKGNKLGTAGQPVAGDIVQLSPDESRLMVFGEGSNSSTWIIDASGPSQAVVFLGDAGYRMWSRDGSSIVFRRGNKLFGKSAAGSGEEREICDAPFGDYLYGLTPDELLVYGSDTGWFRKSLKQGAAPETLSGQASENGNLSPDGEWLVLTKPDRALYVQRVSVATLPKQIAPAGSSAVWRRDGKEIVYRDSDAVWSVRVDGSGTDLHFGKPEKLFAEPPAMGTTSGSRLLAISRNGSPIYDLRSVDQPDSGVIHVRTNAVR